MEPHGGGGGGGALQWYQDSLQLTSIPLAPSVRSVSDFPDRVYPLLLRIVFVFIPSPPPSPRLSSSGCRSPSPSKHLSHLRLFPHTSSLHTTSFPPPRTKQPTEATKSRVCLRQGCEEDSRAGRARTRYDPAVSGSLHLLPFFLFCFVLYFNRGVCGHPPPPTPRYR